MADGHERQHQNRDEAFSDGPVTSKTEPLPELVSALLKDYQAVGIGAKGAKPAVLGGRALARYTAWMAEAHTYLKKASSDDLTTTHASEWVLDNYYIIWQALQQIKQDLTAGFYRQLPKLAGGRLRGLPRIYAIGRDVLSYQNHLLDTMGLQDILIQFQEQVPLTLGELWALPIFLRYSLIETLAHSLAELIGPETLPNLPALPARPVRFSGAAISLLTDRSASDEAAVNAGVANVILSLRAISEQNWGDFVESVSCMERMLRQDPAGVYAMMDRTTRNMYRQEIEQLALATGAEESELTGVVLDLARKGSGKAPAEDGLDKSWETPSAHVGTFLLGPGRSALEKAIDYHPSAKTVLKRLVLRHASAFYLGSIGVISLFILFLVMLVAGLPMQSRSNPLWHGATLLVLVIALAVPILTVSASLVNWLVTMTMKPHILPKLRFGNEIPRSCQTLVVIPGMLASHEDVDNLTRQLEMHYLRNPEPGLLFALLSDFPDADTETLEGDNDLINYATAALDQVNAKHQNAALDGLATADGCAAALSEDEEAGRRAPLFFLLHRRRLWNQAEGKWMGWERKRGKLHELNRLLRGAQDTSFTTMAAGPCGSLALQNVRFVITLDADTVLPRGAARRLVGTLAHPLNRAKFDHQTGQVVSGYTVLQPRMEIHPRSANLSWFTRIFAQDTGLDLYTRAVSNAYQDFFGEGSYVGKGIYDVDAFERSVHERIPENSVLSHDLLEGIMGRAGLVTDITMVEDYPSSYFIQVKRQQRWIRGDWQLLPWLLNRNKAAVKFSAVNRWKILDNLLRALVAPALVLIFVLGVTARPDLAGLWAAIVLLTLGSSILTGLVRCALRTLDGANLGETIVPMRWDLARWMLAVAFLPYEAANALGAVFTTLYRLTISHRDLLRWTTAAQTTHLQGLRGQRKASWLLLIASEFAAVITVGAPLLALYIRGHDAAPAMLLVIPILMLWLVSPWIAWWINRPITHRIIPLSSDQLLLLRRVARRTWGFFERFVGPEDHWLPPDHFQEEPVGIIAHHTSPSNIGLLLTSTLAAYDFGYLDQIGLAARLSTTMTALEQLERYRGHFYNWYDTLTLEPLPPRYVSTVDSGNLAASLIVVAQGARSMPDEHVFRWHLWQGYLDTLANLAETIVGVHQAEFADQVEEINARIAEMHKDIVAAESEPERWYTLFDQARGPFWLDLSSRLGKLVKVGRSAYDLEGLRKLREVAAQVERHHLDTQRTITELLPWIPLLERVPSLFSEVRFAQAIDALKAALPYCLTLGDIQTCAADGLARIADLRDLVEPYDLESATTAASRLEAMSWLDSLDQALDHGRDHGERLLLRFEQVANRFEAFVKEMDFTFLYHPQRRVFHIGLNLDAGQLDNNFYDLLASEARIASIIALAKGEVPQSHWLQLGRPLTHVHGLRTLLSWSATMFEYLMPPLFLRSYPGTLLADSTLGAVRQQIAYGKSKGVPWGVSESGFYQFDANQNYQYRAFGVPGLGFKRGLGDDLVIAPYASLMAIGYDAHAVAHNLTHLLQHDCFGLYGLYESIDFTRGRLPAGITSVVIREYMAHHQGMVLMSLANYCHRDIMVRRMHSDPRIQSVELLLLEQVPPVVPLQNPFAEDVRGVQRLTAAPVEVSPWTVPVHTAIPQVNLLSNGDYGVLISSTGSGYSSWCGIDLTRWQADGTLDPWGTWIYVQDMPFVTDGQAPTGDLWSAGEQPIPGRAPSIPATFFAAMAVFRRTENAITSTMEVTISPADPVEIRRVHLHNVDVQPRRLRLTSYGEVILTQQAVDSRHPAFNKLFIESEFVPELNLQIFARRMRSSDEIPVFMGHMLVIAPRVRGASHQSVRHEADRNRFIGRGQTLRRPAALVSQEYLSGTTGATLDPIFALGQQVELNPQESAELAYLTIAGDSREAIIALAQRYANWSLIEQTFHQANLAAQTWLGKQEYDTQSFQDTLQVLSALIYPFQAARATPETLALNRLDQSGLWRFGISGDHPILLVELDEPKQVDLVRQVLQVHEFMRSRRFLADVVILNRQQSEYGAELTELLHRLVSRRGYERWLNQRGGVFILHADQINAEEEILLQTAARFVLTGERGSLHDQLPEVQIPVHHLPEFAATRSEGTGTINEVDPLPETEALQFFNGYGGFGRDGREYIIDLLPGQPTPAPWINVIGYPEFGFMVSETGSQSTWAINSGENRLTPWFNDPVCDPSGEALYLRDEETGDVWTPTPLPAGADQPYRVTHGAGYTVFEHHSHGLRQRLTLYASPDDPVKIIHLRVENTGTHTRRVTATQYIEWVLGTTHASSMQYIVPHYDADEACLLATNPNSAEFGERVAFLIASKPVHGLTADRTEFLGRLGTRALPIALRRLGLETRLSPGEDPCAALQLHLDLHEGTSEEIYFVLGQGNDKAHALELARKYHNVAHVSVALEETREFWNRLLGTVQVHTPEPATDLILNRWLLYQSLSCRIWGRSALYQPSGAFGFRDQLQDVLALLPIDPAITRNQILSAARHQFTEGDVMHWWHPPSDRGVRTRISDDLVWLPYVTAMYVQSTGDMGILQEPIPFLDAPPLAWNEEERYNRYPLTQETYSLFEHCQRAIAKGATHGEHGLPLIGTGDWNDGLNRVGAEGQGESVWLAWFLCDVLERFAQLCDLQGESGSAQHYRTLAIDYAAAVERSAWDGAWYRRAYYDNGSALGSAQSMEGQIDAIAQSWSVLSGAGDPNRSRQALQSVLDRLILPKDRLSLLFAPPFDKTEQDPGYIKGYFPGIRENGGQYTHASTWTAWAFARLGDGRQAGELYELLNPILRSDTMAKADAYRVEPYVISADVYSQYPHLRRGGWTWYTGSAAWMYRLGLEAMLGFVKTGNTLRIDPVIPPAWDGYNIDYQYGNTRYHIEVHNPKHLARGVQRLELDGSLLDDTGILLVQDGRQHSVVVIMGDDRDPQSLAADLATNTA